MLTLREPQSCYAAKLISRQVLLRESLTRFSTSGFFIKQFPSFPDLWANAVSTGQTTKLLKLFLFVNRQLSILFYCNGVGKITYGCFLLDCAFNGFYKSRQNGVLNSRYAKKLCAKPKKNSESQIFANISANTQPYAKLI
jgi:hypothetical protein